MMIVLSLNVGSEAQRKRVTRVGSPRSPEFIWWGTGNIHFSDLHSRKVKLRSSVLSQLFDLSNDLFTKTFTAQMGRVKKYSGVPHQDAECSQQQEETETRHIKHFSG
jgi:hypothetical protein